MLAAPESSSADLAHLQAIAAPLRGLRVVPFGVPELDLKLGAGGLRAGALHEVTAHGCSLVDDAAREARGGKGLVLWASVRSDLYAPGLEQVGLRSADVIHARPRDDAALLAVIEDAVRDGTPCCVVAEASRVPMVATRRLQLVAADADMPVLLLRRRRSREQDPFGEPSAAWTRWRIASAPSQRLSVPGVGRARWSVELARQRGGDPFSLIVEACDETGRLAVPAALGHRTAETAGPARHAAA